MNKIVKKAAIVAGIYVAGAIAGGTVVHKAHMDILEYVIPGFRKELRNVMVDTLAVKMKG